MMSGLEIWLKIISSAKKPPNKNERLENITLPLPDGWSFENLKWDDKRKLFPRIIAKL